MNDELDRRIAIEVMGEPQPSHDHSWLGASSDGGNWVCTWRFHDGRSPEWSPVDFSGDFDEAMRAADKVLETDHRLRLNIDYVPAYFEEGEMWAASLWLHAAATDGKGEGNAAPEAICRALLAYKEK